MRPVIGIVICGVTDHRQFVTSSYIEAIESAGGLPVVIPLNFADLTSYLHICHGFLFCGGADINPLLYGEELCMGNGHTDWNTDHFHLTLMKTVLSSNIPVLAVCRGMQLLNIALGGSLWQDISLSETSPLQHMQNSESRFEPAHKITISSDSILSCCLGDSCLVNSFHHQCIKEPGNGIKITALSSDGIIEAIEHIKRPFTLGVQWHPECMLSFCPDMGNIFVDFISHATEYLNPE